MNDVNESEMNDVNESEMNESEMNESEMNESETTNVTTSTSTPHMISCANSSDGGSGRACSGQKTNEVMVSKEAACAAGCKKCGGGGNFSQPRTNQRRACGVCSENIDECVVLTEKTKFACGYKPGWKGPRFWDFATGGLQWGAHVGGDGSRAGGRKCNLSCA